MHIASFSANEHFLYRVNRLYIVPMLRPRNSSVTALYTPISQCVNRHVSQGYMYFTSSNAQWPFEDSSDIPEETTRDTTTHIKRRRHSKLSNKALKLIRSIERLYRPKTAVTQFSNIDNDGISTDSLLLPRDKRDASLDTIPSSDTSEYGPTKALVRSIYRSATGNVFNDALWKRYVHKISAIHSTLKPADLCIVLYSFAKVKYLDNELLKLLTPLIVRNISNLSCGGAALILNALKRLEVPNHDIIELATNELCLKMDHANLQDIALTANALAYFQVQHQRFWNMLTRAVSLRHHQMTPLQASLILASLAKMDMRIPLMLRLLKDKLRAAVERGDLSQELLTLCFHSLAKLDFSANNFYNACTEQFTQMLDMQPEAVDTQSLVLYLYTAVCILDVPQTAIIKSLEVLAQRKDVLSNYKAWKMKFVIDFLENKYPTILEVLNKETLDLLDKIKEYKLYKAKKTLSRWSLEVSRCLKKHNIRHRTNVKLDHLYADILIPDLSVIVKCAGPFSYYVKSQRLTTFAQIEHKALTMKGYKVCILPYYEWNALKTDDQKLEYLKKFGETWASVHFGNGTEQSDMA